MGVYEHIIVLLSFIYALALTHVFSRLGGLLLARRRVKFSGLLALAQAVAIEMVFMNWLYLWNLHSIQTWSIVPVIIEFAFASSIYFVCILCAPDVPAEGTIDMEAFYWDQRQPFYAAALLVQFIGAIGLGVYTRMANSGVGWDQILLLVPPGALLALAYAVRARWAQWTGLIGYFVVVFFVWTAVLVMGHG